MENSSKKIHVCILSAQLLANYLPVKLYKPDIILLVETEYTRRERLGERFQNMVKKYLKSLCLPAKALAPDDDFNKLCRYFLDLSEKIASLKEELGGEVTLNLTGGTKLMAIAAYDMLKKECCQTIYTNTASGKIDIISSTPPGSMFLPPLLGITEYLMAYGVSPKHYNNENPEWEKKVKSRKSLTLQLAESFSQKKNKGFMGVLNAIVQNFLGNNSGSKISLAFPKQKFRHNVLTNQKKLLIQCEKNGLLTYDRGRTIEFQSVEAARYLGGFWLEEYVWFMIKDAGIEQVRCGQEIQWDKKTQNELDIVAIHNNRLLIVECKTRRYAQDSRKDNDTIYKLDSVAKDLRGLYGKKWLISAGKVPEDTITRAKPKEIEVISGEAIAPEKLKRAIQKWMNTSAKQKTEANYDHQVYTGTFQNQDG